MQKQDNTRGLNHKLWKGADLVGAFFMTWPSLWDYTKREYPCRAGILARNHQESVSVLDKNNPKGVSQHAPK